MGPPECQCHFLPIGVAPLTPNPHTRLVVVSLGGDGGQKEHHGELSPPAAARHNAFPSASAPRDRAFLPSGVGGMRDERGASSSGYQRSPPTQFPGSPFPLTQVLGPGPVPASNVSRPRSGPPPAFTTGGLTSGSVHGPPPLSSYCHTAPKKNPVLRRPRAFSTALDTNVTHRPPSWVWAAPLDQCRAAG
ncbi:hypothetical protein NDU88_003237 [Pleurodeles waltl]|uniref:Uncharacterized protein n=1 Tax=Pleurodeles waltl TaxID=8319 RepID=A0AAV7MQ64_PLEWA|nr:hypothetical protein NDU88_003237 [Pleurodeles waltl]